MSPSGEASAVGALENVLRKDKSVVTLGLFVLTGLAWTYMLYLVWAMPGMHAESGALGGVETEMAMPLVRPWGAIDFLLMFIMWSVMMVAMMVPSAAPMVLLFASMNRKRREREAPYVPTAFFLGGYLLAWTVFSAAATLVQWTLHNRALLSPMMVSTSPVLGGTLLLASGIFQFTSLKQACLAHCRSPLHFFMSKWMDGRTGALSMGIKHGVYCVGCCWILMALLFVAGVMNLFWVAAITVFVLVERVVPKGDLVGRAAGLVLLLAGVAVLTRGLA